MSDDTPPNKTSPSESWAALVTHLFNAPVGKILFFIGLLLILIALIGEWKGSFSLTLIRQVVIVLIAVLFTIPLIWQEFRRTRKTPKVPEPAQSAPNPAPPVISVEHVRKHLSDIYQILHECSVLCSKARAASGAGKHPSQLYFVGITLGLGIAHVPVLEEKFQCSSHAALARACRYGEKITGKKLTECLSDMHADLKGLLMQASKDNQSIVVTLDPQLIQAEFVEPLYRQNYSYTTKMNWILRERQISEEKFFQDLTREIVTAHTDIYNANRAACLYESTIRDLRIEQFIVADISSNGSPKKACIFFDATSEPSGTPTGFYSEEPSTCNFYIAMARKKELALTKKPSN